MARDERKARLGHARPVPVDEGQLPDRHDHRLLVDELLDAVEDPLTPLGVPLARLLGDEPLDVGIGAVGERAAGRHERVEPGGGVAEGAARGLDDVLELLLAVLEDERRALEGPELHPDPDRLEVVDHRLAEIGVGAVAEVLPGVEAVRVAGFGQKLPRALGIVRRDGRGPVGLERVRDHVAGDARKAQGLGLVDGRPIDRHARGQPEPPVVPGRLRIGPLLGEHEPEGTGRIVRLEREPRGPPQFFGERTADLRRESRLETRLRRFNSDTPVQLAIEGFIHHPHSAFAHLATDFETVGNYFTGLEGRRRVLEGDGRVQEKRSHLLFPFDYI